MIQNVKTKYTVCQDKTNYGSDSTVTTLICIKLKNQSLKLKRILKSILFISLLFVLNMVATRRSQLIEVNENFFAYHQRDLERKKNRAQAAREKKARMEDRKPVKRNREAEKLLAMFESWKFPQKYELLINLCEKLNANT